MSGAMSERAERRGHLENNAVYLKRHMVRWSRIVWRNKQLRLGKTHKYHALKSRYCWILLAFNQTAFQILACSTKQRADPYTTINKILYSKFLNFKQQNLILKLSKTKKELPSAFRSRKLVSI